MLRDYQELAIKEIRTNRSLIYLATGSGKSVIFKDVARDVLSKNKKVCFVVYGKSIVDQAARKHFSEITKSICMVMAENKYSPGHDLYCCSISTILRSTKTAKALISECDLFIIDEAHNFTADKYRAFLDAIPSSKQILGLTATPFWVGNRGHSFWEQVIHPISTQGLIKKGYLVKPRIFGPPYKMTTDGVHITAGEYNNKELFEANDSAVIYGNIVESWKKHANGLRTICFGINKAHAWNIMHTFVSGGIPAAYADADTPQDERLRLIRQLANKEILVLCNVNIFSTGVDIPEIECALMARPTKSLVLWIQQVGRALRLYENKKEAIIIDCAANTPMLGHPLEDFPANLDDRRAPRQKSEIEIKTKTCPNCFYVTRAAAIKCEFCDYLFEVADDKHIINVEVDLIEHTLEKQMKKWMRSHFYSKEPPDDVLKVCDSIMEKIIKYGWKKNSFFFKVIDRLGVEKAQEHIRIPSWVTTKLSDTSDLQNSLNSKYKKNSSEDEYLSDM